MNNAFQQTEATAQKIIAATNSIQEAKEIVADIRATAISVANKYGDNHVISREFWQRYYIYLDELMCKYC